MCKPDYYSVLRVGLLISNSSNVKIQTLKLTFVHLAAHKTIRNCVLSLLSLALDRPIYYQPDTNYTKKSICQSECVNNHFLWSDWLFAAALLKHFQIYTNLTLALAMLQLLIPIHRVQEQMKAFQNSNFSLVSQLFSCSTRY